MGVLVLPLNPVSSNDGGKPKVFQPVCVFLWPTKTAIVLDRIWSAALVAAHCVGFVIIDEGLLDRIKGELATQFPADGGREAGEVSVAGYRGVAHWLLARLDTVKDIPPPLDRVRAENITRFSVFDELGVADFDSSEVSGFHPAVFTFETDRAGAKPLDPVSLVVEAG